MKVETLGTTTGRVEVLTIEERNFELVEEIGKNRCRIEEIRKEVIRQESPKLDAVIDFVKNSGRINFEEIFTDPEHVIDIFKDEIIIPDLQVRPFNNVLDQSIKNLIIFDKFKDGDILTEKKVLLTSKDRRDAGDFILRKHLDIYGMGVREFGSKETGSLLVFTKVRLLTPTNGIIPSDRF